MAIEIGKVVAQVHLSVAESVRLSLPSLSSLSLSHTQLGIGSGVSVDLVKHRATLSRSRR